MPTPVHLRRLLRTGRVVRSDIANESFARAARTAAELGRPLSAAGKIGTTATIIPSDTDRDLPAADRYAARREYLLSRMSVDEQARWHEEAQRLRADAEALDRKPMEALTARERALRFGTARYDGPPLPGEEEFRLTDQKGDWTPRARLLYPELTRPNDDDDPTSVDIVYVPEDRLAEFQRAHPDAERLPDLPPDWRPLDAEETFTYEIPALRPGEHAERRVAEWAQDTAATEAERHHRTVLKNLAAMAREPIPGRDLSEAETIYFSTPANPELGVPAAEHVAENPITVAKQRDMKNRYASAHVRSGIVSPEALYGDTPRTAAADGGETVLTSGESAIGGRYWDVLQKAAAPFARDTDTELADLSPEEAERVAARTAARLRAAVAGGAGGIDGADGRGDVDAILGSEGVSDAATDLIRAAASIERRRRAAEEAEAASAMEARAADVTLRGEGVRNGDGVEDPARVDVRSSADEGAALPQGVMSRSMAGVERADPDALAAAAGKLLATTAGPHGAVMTSADADASIVNDRAAARLAARRAVAASRSGGDDDEIKRRREATMRDSFRTSTRDLMSRTKDVGTASSSSPASQRVPLGKMTASASSGSADYFAGDVEHLRYALPGLDHEDAAVLTSGPFRKVATDWLHEGLRAWRYRCAEIYVLPFEAFGVVSTHHMDAAVGAIKPHMLLHHGTDEFAYKLKETVERLTAAKAKDFPTLRDLRRRTPPSLLRELDANAAAIGARPSGGDATAKDGMLLHIPYWLATNLYGGAPVAAALQRFHFVGPKTAKVLALDPHGIPPPKTALDSDLLVDAITNGTFKDYFDGSAPGAAITAASAVDEIDDRFRRLAAAGLRLSAVATPPEVRRGMLSLAVHLQAVGPKEFGSFLGEIEWTAPTLYEHWEAEATRSASGVEKFCKSLFKDDDEIRVVVLVPTFAVPTVTKRLASLGAVRATVPRVPPGATVPAAVADDFEGVEGVVVNDVDRDFLRADPITKARLREDVSVTSYGPGSDDPERRFARSDLTDRDRARIEKMYRSDRLPGGTSAPRAPV